MSPSSHQTSTDLLPEHEAFRRAIRWVSQLRRERPDAPLHELVNEASRKFDLSPREELSLLSLLRP